MNINKKLIEALIIDEVKHAFRKLGIEGTLQAIEAIANAKQRVMMRAVVYKLIDKEV